MAEEETPTVISGDILDTVISRLRLIDLLPAYHVAKDWRSAVIWSASNLSRAKPWLVAHVQNTQNPSLLVTHAYDPSSQLWIELPPATASSPLRSSQPNFLYTLTPSKLSFSVDPLNAKWQDVDGPKVWRLDPIVAMVGSDIVVAGGTYDFEDDPLAVEVYNLKSRKWEMCQSMPDILKDSAFTTWISVAVWDDKMFLLEKSSGILCIFDMKAKSWGNAAVLRPNPSLFFSLIGFVNGRLVLIGLLGDSESVESLRIWEVNCETFSCSEIAKMPSEMFKKLISSCETYSSVTISTTNDFLYIYNGSGRKEIFLCEISKSLCHWGSVPKVVDEDDFLVHRFVVNCSQVGFSDIQRAFENCSRR